MSQNTARSKNAVNTQSALFSASVTQQQQLLVITTRKMHWILLETKLWFSNKNPVAFPHRIRTALPGKLEFCTLYGTLVWYWWNIMNRLRYWRSVLLRTDTELVESWIPCYRSWSTGNKRHSNVDFTWSVTLLIIKKNSFRVTLNKKTKEISVMCRIRLKNNCFKWHACRHWNRLSTQLHA